MSRIGIAALAAAAGFVATFACAQSPAEPAVVMNTCESCHGRDGNGTQPNIPRLNGQRAQYMVTRLKDFLDPGRQDPHATSVMWNVVQTVDDDTLKSVADYYSGLKPMAASPPATALAVRGRAFFLKGNPAEHVQACQSCHGANGEGAGAAPRIAGQHGEYLRNQLEWLRLALRASETMHANTNNLTDDQINALVAYLAKD
jgi:cytochrome c553